MSYYYSQTKVFAGGEPEHYHIWLFDETSGTNADDSGTGGGTTGLDDGTIENSVAFVNDATKGDVYEFTLSSNDRVNMGSVESTTGLTNLTLSFNIKPLSTSGALQVVINNDASGSINGDFNFTIVSSGTKIRFTMQTSPSETKTVEANVTVNSWSFVLLTWDSVAKAIKIYTTDISTADATNTYTGTSKPLESSENYNHGANTGSSNSAACRQGKVKISPVIANQAERQAIADAA